MTKGEKDKNFVWHPFDVIDLPEHVFIKKATGIFLHTNDGRKIMDAISSWWVNIHGHRHPQMIKAVSKQLRYLEHVIFAGFTHEPAIRLAENLLKMAPHCSKVFYSDNGSTSTEIALKIAMHYWYNLQVPRKKIIAIEGAYHGDTFGAMAVGARGGFNAPFEPYLFDVEFIPFPTPPNTAQSVNQFKTLCERQDVAAFIYEPLVQGSAGMRMYDPQVLDRLLDIAKSQEVICIADEVMTGFGRTGKTFASDHCSLLPDIVCLSKGLTGGYLPLGATLVTDELYQAFNSKEIDKIFLHGHSYTANPLACAAANESIRLLHTKDTQGNIQRISTKFSEIAISLAAHPKLDNCRSIGCILAMDVKNEGDNSYFNPLRDKIYHAFLAKNILLRPLGNTIYVLPPYIITDRQIDQIVSAIHAILDEVV